MYKYGVYGEIGADIINGVSRASTVAVYFGTAPVNLLQDYSGKVNEPIRISNMNEARQLLGGQFSSSDKWTKYTLCEAIEAHFNNRIGNVGPIYVINVLDPATHQGEEETVQLTFANKKATVTADDIIISTFAIEGKVLGTDYTLSYDTGKGVLTVTDIGTTPMTNIQASYTPVDFDSIDEDVVIGGKDTSGATTGIAALGKVYRKYNAVPTYLAAPGWTETPAVYNALVSASQLINDHWYAFVFADIPVTADTIDEAIEWKATNDYTSGASKVFWPKAEDNGTVYHLSTLALVEKMRVDISHNNVPFKPSRGSRHHDGHFLGRGLAHLGRSHGGICRWRQLPGARDLRHEHADAVLHREQLPARLGRDDRPADDRCAARHHSQPRTGEAGCSRRGRRADRFTDGRSRRWQHIC